MSTALLVALFGGGTVSGITVAILNGLIFKKRTGAEAAELIQRAASGLTTSMSAELARAATARREADEKHAADRAEWKAERAQLMSDWADERAEQRAVLQLHAAWDALALASARNAGLELPEAPPLLPPHR